MLRMLVWEVVPGRGQKGPGSPGGRVARMTPAHPGFLGVATVGARFLNTEVRGLLGGHHELTTYSMRKVTCWGLDLQSFSTPSRSYRSADDPPSFK